MHGFAIGQVERWLVEKAGYAEAKVRSLTAVEGGVSNLTFRLGLEGTPWRDAGLRLEREHGIFEPYDVVREARVLRCLEASDIPGPAAYAWEGDVRWLGARFLLMEWIDAPHMGSGGQPVSFQAFTEMVVRIHAQDWEGLGLAFLGVPAKPVEGIRAELEDIVRRMTSFGCAGERLLAEAARRLVAQAPDDGRTALCHGDINVFNYLFRDGRVAGVVDWERARIGDPRCDVGQMVALAHLTGVPWMEAADVPFVRVYEEVSGHRLAGMTYFRARWLFELAVIYHGWVRLNGSEPWYSWGDVSSLLKAAMDEVG